MAAAGAEHDIVGALAVHVRLVKLAVKMLDVAATTVDVLLMLHGEPEACPCEQMLKKLNHQNDK